MIKFLTVTAVVALCAGAPAMALAQATSATPVPPGSKQTIPEKDPSAGGNSPPVSVSNGAPSEGRSTSLSTKLDRSNGVITPPSNVDPGMTTGAAPAPNPNSTPVITPPSAGAGGIEAK